MPLSKDMVIERLRKALGAAINEARQDPNFAPRILQTICTELGIDAVAAMYLSGKLRSMLQRKADAGSDPAD